MPHLAARGWVQATMPLVLWTTLLRLGHFMNSPDGGGYTDDVGSGMANLEEWVNDRRVTSVSVSARVVVVGYRRRDFIVVVVVLVMILLVYIYLLYMYCYTASHQSCPISARPAVQSGPELPLLHAIAGQISTGGSPPPLGGCRCGDRGEPRAGPAFVLCT